MESNVAQVSFMILGAMKCGTSSLAAALAQHPDICFCSQKEPHFFSRTDDWRAHLAGYHALFHPDHADQLWGEASTTYTTLPEFNLDTHKDLCDYNPKLKFIYLMRDPLERVVSQYMHEYQRGHVDTSLAESLRETPRLINRGRYYSQLKPYLDTFGRSAILLITFEEMKNQWESVITRVCQFLDISVDPLIRLGEMHANATLNRPTVHVEAEKVLHTSWFQVARRFVPQSVRQWAWQRLTNRVTRSFDSRPALTTSWQETLINLYATEVQATAELMGRPLLEWPSFYDEALNGSNSESSTITS